METATRLVDARAMLTTCRPCRPFHSRPGVFKGTPTTVAAHSANAVARTYTPGNWGLPQPPKGTGKPTRKNSGPLRAWMSGPPARRTHARRTHAHTRTADARVNKRTLACTHRRRRVRADGGVEEGVVGVGGRLRAGPAAGNALTLGSFMHAGWSELHMRDTAFKSIGTQHHHVCALPQPRTIVAQARALAVPSVGAHVDVAVVRVAVQLLAHIVGPDNYLLHKGGGV
jgi:hypothetical protein